MIRTPTNTKTDTTNATSNADSKPSSNHGLISPTMEAMLEKYAKLDEESKKALKYHAISSNNEALKHRLMMLHDNQSKSGSITKLTKEIIKLAETLKRFQS
jgi:hypothetical protein